MTNDVFAAAAAAVQQQVVEIETSADERIRKAVEELDIWFDPPGMYYRPDDRGLYKGYTVSDARLELTIIGLSDTKHKTESACEVDLALRYVRNHRVVDWVGSIAGYDSGPIMQGRRFRVLNKEPTNPLEAVEGDYEAFETFCIKLLGPEQYLYFCAWCKQYFKQLYHRTWYPGQLLIIVGPPSCGKTLLSSCLLEMTGGTATSPLDYLTGVTRFNADVCGSTLLLIDDDSVKDLSSKITMSSKFKALFFSDGIRVEAKGAEPITLKPLYRGMSLHNDSHEDIAAIPAIRPGTEDKMMIFKAQDGAIIPELAGMKMLPHLRPAFPGWLHMIMNRDYPEGIADGRYGVKFYHHPEVRAMLDNSAAEADTLELIEQACFRDDEDEGEDHVGRLKVYMAAGRPYIEGSAADIYRHCANHWDRGVQQQCHGTVRTITYMGRQLNRLADTRRDRVIRVGQKRGTQRYQVLAPVVD